MASSATSTLEAPEAPFLVGQRPAQHQRELRGVQRLQHHDPGPGQEGGVDLEGRVLGGGPDEGHVAGLHVGEQRVLLPLVVAMDLVDEQHGAAAVVLPAVLGLLQDLAQLLDAGEHGAQRLEVRGGEAAHDVGERRLARARRPPQDDRGYPVGEDRAPERRVGAERFFLADDLVQRAGPHAIGQRGVGARGVGGRGIGRKQQAGASSPFAHAASVTRKGRAQRLRCLPASNKQDPRRDRDVEAFHRRPPSGWRPCDRPGPRPPAEARPLRCRAGGRRGPGSRRRRTARRVTRSRS